MDFRRIEKYITNVQWPNGFWKGSVGKHCVLLILPKEFLLWKKESTIHLLKENFFTKVKSFRWQRELWKQSDDTSKSLFWFQSNFVRVIQLWNSVWNLAEGR